MSKNSKKNKKDKSPESSDDKSIESSVSEEIKKPELKRGEERIYIKYHVLKNGEVKAYERNRYIIKGNPRGRPQTPLSRVKHIIGLLNEEQLINVEKYLNNLLK